jgi:hypothetical protein
MFVMISVAHRCFVSIQILKDYVYGFIPHTIIKGFVSKRKDTGFRFLSISFVDASCKFTFLKISFPKRVNMLLKFTFWKISFAKCVDASFPFAFFRISFGNCAELLFQSNYAESRPRSVDQEFNYPGFCASTRRLFSNSEAFRLQLLSKRHFNAISSGFRWQRVSTRHLKSTFSGYCFRSASARHFREFIWKSRRGIILKFSL